MSGTFLLYGIFKSISKETTPPSKRFEVQLNGLWTMDYRQLANLPKRLIHIGYQIIDVF